MVVLRVSEMAAPEVMPVRFEVRDLRPRADGASATTEALTHRGDDAGGDLILDGEDVLGVAVEAIRPELESARDIGTAAP